jgi:PAT family beta-lactamase induction signal transducer AmpG
MLLGQAVVMIAILGMAVVGPGAGLQAFAALAMLTAFASATQDIAVDAWRIESASDAEQDLMASAYTFGLRCGYFVGNAPILAGSAIIGWSGAYALAALGGVLGLVAILLAQEPRAARDFKPLQSPRATIEAVWTPVRLFIQDNGRVGGIMLLLTAVYFVPDGIIAPLVGALYIDLGYQGAEIAAVRTVFGITAALLGVVTAGVLGMRFGTLPVLALGAALSASSNLGFTALALSGGSKAIWIGVVVIEGFSAGLAQTAMLAWAGRLTNIKATAAQFALLSSLMTLLPGLLGGFAGLAVETLQSLMGDPLAGYATYFALTTGAGAGPLVLILLLQRLIPVRRTS